MSEIANYLRYLINGDKTAKVSSINAITAPQSFTSNLDTDSYTRKHLFVYNNSPSASGECFLGFSGDLSSVNGYPIPAGAEKQVRIAQTVPIYFCSSSGENGDLRIFEIA